MKTILKNSLVALAACLAIACSGDDDNSSSNNNNNNNNNPGTYTNVQREFDGLQCNFFKPDGTNYKGIVSLGSGNDPMDPAPGSLNDGYLVSLAQKLAAKGYLVSIVGYRDQPPVGANWENWTSNVAMLATDLSDVATAMGTEFDLPRSKVVLGGSSYSANALVSHSAWGTGTFLDTRGFIAIMGSASMETAQNIKSPILAFACNGEPFGTHYGENMYNSISNATIKNQSYGYTDMSCSGHGTSNSWHDVIVQKVEAWLP